ncbi:olfactory receptor 1G1-like [Sphaerodactylus townsendi]|uniref:olfactory receptor 1G1-like n=1 Tax=Sphaerodactylus townsendi TaxID=933632 RepID=UPI0020271C46|nr:olfactory receptor 1G1-like [Sphaerodactylus townsendi]
MEKKNQTLVSGFILQAIFNQAGHGNLVFFVLLLVYMLSLVGNLMIVFVIWCDSHLLHTPMYFFLSYLALADVGFASSTVPITLRSLVSWDKIISYGGCFSQLYFFLAFGSSDSFLLAAMAYDRYMAICHPLHYIALINPKRCRLMVSGCWLLAFLHSVPYALMVSHLSFCASREIPNFFCDVNPLLGLSCSDTSTIKMMLWTAGTLSLAGPFLLVVISYARIFLTIVKTPSASSKRKAFSTCGSHLAVVILYFSTLIWVYLLPTSGNKTLASLMYTVIAPMLNPFIYSLRNSEMKGALKRLTGRMRVSVE